MTGIGSFYRINSFFKKEKRECSGENINPGSVHFISPQRKGSIPKVGVRSQAPSRARCRSFFNTEGTELTEFFLFSFFHHKDHIDHKGFSFIFFIFHHEEHGGSSYFSLGLWSLVLGRASPQRPQRFIFSLDTSLYTLNFFTTEFTDFFRWSPVELHHKRHKNYSFFLCT